MVTGVEGPLFSLMPRERKTYYVYIMGSLSGTFYIGMSGNLRKRAFEHRFHRIEGFTDKYLAERLLYYESFDEVVRAINREKQLKGWRRSKKIALIEWLNPHWVDLARELFPRRSECSVRKGPSGSRSPSTPQTNSHSQIRPLRSG